MPARGENVPLRGERRGERRLISPKAGILLLVAAAGCAMVAEVVWNGGGPRGARGARALVSLGVGTSEKQAAASAPMDIMATSGKGKGSDVGEGIDKTIRGIPVVGDAVADGWRKITGGKVNRPYLADAPKVKVDFYMESLCPGCQYFSTHVLDPVMREPGMSGLVDFKIVPAGNAALEWKGGKLEMTCQHGEEECEGNRILACLSQKHRTDANFISTVTCMEKGDSGFSASDAAESAFRYINETMIYNMTASQPVLTRMGKMASACIEQGGFKSSPIMQCANSPQGEHLAQVSFNETASLTPKLEYAPWVVIDGVPIKEDAYSFKEWVCRAYKGTPPRECEAALLKDYYPKSTTLHRAPGAHGKQAAKAGKAKSARGDMHALGLKGYKQLLAAWKGGDLFQKCMPN